MYNVHKEKKNCREIDENHYDQVLSYFICNPEYHRWENVITSKELDYIYSIISRKRKSLSCKNMKDILHEVINYLLYIKKQYDLGIVIKFNDLKLENCIHSLFRIKAEIQEREDKEGYEENMKEEEEEENE